MGLDTDSPSTFSAVVIVSRQGMEDLLVQVQVSEKMLERMDLKGGFKRVRAARNRAAEVLYGKGCRFESDGVPHRGVVWARLDASKFSRAISDGSGSWKVTDPITMRVVVEADG